MELKVWVNSVQRVVCGVTPTTTCQDVIIALAQAMGRTGRFNLIERWRGVERPLGSADSPLEVLQKWGEYAHEVKFVLRESAVKKKKKNKDPLTEPVTATRTHRGHAVSGGKGAPTKGARGGAVKKSLSFSGASFAAGGLSTPAGRAQQKKVLSSAASLGAPLEQGPDNDNASQDLLSTIRPSLSHSGSAESEQNEGMASGHRGPMSGKPASHSQLPAAAPRPSMLRQTSSSASAAGASAYPRAGLPSSSALSASAASSHQVQHDGVSMRSVSGDAGGSERTVSRVAELPSAPEVATQTAGHNTPVQPASAPLVPPLAGRDSAARVPLPRRQSRSLSIVEADSETSSKPTGSAVSSSSSVAAMPSRASGTMEAGSPSGAVSGGRSTGSGPGYWDRRSTAAATVVPAHTARALALSLASSEVVLDSPAAVTSEAVVAAGPRAEKPSLPVLNGGARPARASGPDSAAEVSVSPVPTSANGMATGGRADAGAMVPHTVAAGDNRRPMQSSETVAAAGAGEKAVSLNAGAAAAAAVTTAAPGGLTQGVPPVGATGSDQRAPASSGTKSTGGHSSLFRALAEEVKGQQRASMLPRCQPPSTPSNGTSSDGSVAHGGGMQNPTTGDVSVAAMAASSSSPRPPPAAGQASASREGATRAATGQPAEPAAGRSQAGDAVHGTSNGPHSQAASAGAVKAATSQRSVWAAAVDKGRTVAGSSAAVEQQELREAGRAGASGPVVSGSGTPQSLAAATAAVSMRVSGSGQPAAARSGAAQISGGKRKEGELAETSEEYERLLNVVSLQRETLTLQQSRLELFDKEIASRRQKEQGKADETAAMRRLLTELEATCKHLDRELEQNDGEHDSAGGHEPSLSSAELDSLRREAERSRAAITAERSRVAECDRELSEHVQLAEQLGAHVEACRQQLAQLSAAAAAASGTDRDAVAECQRLLHLISEERAALEQLEAECSRATDDLQKAEESVAAKRRAIDTVELELRIGSKGDSSVGGPTASLPASSGAAVTSTKTTVSAAAASGWSREERGLAVKAAAAARAPASAASGSRGSVAAKGASSGVYC